MHRMVKRQQAMPESKFAARMRDLRANPVAMVLLFIGAVGVIYVLGPSSRKDSCPRTVSC